MLIGRRQEIQELQQAYDSDESKFVAIFGRRRIGKTYLVREVFRDNFAFTYSGMAQVTTKEQLKRFYLTLKSLDSKVVHIQTIGLRHSICWSNFTE